MFPDFGFNMKLSVLFFPIGIMLLNFILILPCIRNGCGDMNLLYVCFYVCRIVQLGHVILTQSRRGSCIHLKREETWVLHPSAHSCAGNILFSWV